MIDAKNDLFAAVMTTFFSYLFPISPKYPAWKPFVYTYNPCHEESPYLHSRDLLFAHRCGPKLLRALRRRLGLHAHEQSVGGAASRGLRADSQPPCQISGFLQGV